MSSGNDGSKSNTPSFRPCDTDSSQNHVGHQSSREKLSSPAHKSGDIETEKDGNIGDKFISKELPVPKPIRNQIHHIKYGPPESFIQRTKKKDKDGKHPEITLEAGTA